MKPAIALWLLVAAGVAHAAPLIDEPVAELRLKSGKVLTQAIAKSYTPTSVFIRHAAGATSIKYEELPDDIATTLAIKRPAPPTAEQLAEQESRRQLAAVKQAEEMARNAELMERRKKTAAEDAARRARNAESDNKIAELAAKYEKEGVWINKVQFGNGDTLFVEFANDSDSSHRWDMRDVVGLSKTGTPCNAIRVVSMNRTESLFDTMTIPAKSKKTYHISFDRPDGTWPKDMIWKR